MTVDQKTLSITSRSKRTTDFTREVESIVQASGIQTGIVSIYCHHTSCSLVIMENADPSARRDLETWLDKWVAEDDPDFTHTLEGPDDMPSHIKMALTRTSETLPVTNGRIYTGTWQGIFLWEHRARAHTRKITVSVIGD